MKKKITVITVNYSQHFDMQTYKKQANIYKHIN